jgi:hypothetical protein
MPPGSARTARSEEATKTTEYIGCTLDDIQLTEEERKRLQEAKRLNDAKRAGQAGPQEPDRSAGDPKNKPPIRSRDYIETLYEDFGASDFVCVFSANGFLEANAKYEKLFNRVAKAVVKGLRIFYCFPHTDHATRSITDFNSIVQDLARLTMDGLTDHTVAKQVKGYFLKPEKSDICTSASRFFLTGKYSNDRMTFPIGRNRFMEVTTNCHHFLKTLIIRGSTI